MIALLVELVLLLLLLAAAYGDVRRGKISNRLVLMGVCLGIVLTAVKDRTLWTQCLLSGAGAFLIGFLFWKLGVFKAGDAKLLWMMGCFCTGYELPKRMAAIFLVGGACSLWLMLSHRVFRKKMRRLWLYFKLMLLQRKFAFYSPEENDPLRFPFAVAVLEGELLYQLSQLHP